MKRLLSAVFSCVVMLVLSVVCASADTPVNGISVSQDILSRGDEFTVTLYAPPSGDADTAIIKTVFDSSAFEVTKWDVSLPGAYAANYGDGFFSASAANASRAIDLSEGMTLTAAVRVKDTAESGTYWFELADSSLCYVEDSGVNFIELWEPECTSAKLRIVTDRAEVVSSAAAETMPADTQLDIQPGNEESGGNITRILIIAGAAVLIVGLCFVAVKFGTGRK